MPTGFAELVRDSCVQYGNFTLRSGKTSNWYFDKYQLLSSASLRAHTAAHMAVDTEELLDGSDSLQAVAGPELGGAILASRAADLFNLPALFVRKGQKAYGTQHSVEGRIPDEPAGVVLVEDVVTTGSDVLSAAHALEEVGFQVVLILAVLDRGGGEKIREHGYSFHALWTPGTLGLEGHSNDGD
jgi:orotate phosphoribosyltransferase